MKRLSDMTEPEIEIYLQRLGALVEMAMPSGPSQNKKALFAIIVNDSPTFVRYVSNAERKTVIGILRKTADTLEASLDL